MQYPWRQSYDPWFPDHLKYPEHTMYDTVNKTAEKRESEIALYYFNHEMSYVDLMTEIDKASKALKADGFKPKDVITICLPNIPQAVILFYAINRMGGICNMLHPLSPAKEIVKAMEKTDSHVLFVFEAQMKKHQRQLESRDIRRIVPCSVSTYMDKRTAAFFKLKFGRKIGKMPQGEPYLSYPEFLVKAEGQGYPPVYERAARSPAVYLHSGGTTGEPKTIVLSDYNFNALAVQGPGIIGQKEGSEEITKNLHIAILPLFHGFGLGIGMHLMLSLGIKLVLVPKFSPEEMAKVIKKRKPTILAGVPTLFEGMTRAKALKRADLSHLKHVFCGGDPLLPELRKRVESFFQSRGAEIRIREGYGLTETVTVNTVSPQINNKDKTVGLPLSDIYVKICDLETAEALPLGEEGEICVTGPTNMLGYLKDPEATKHAMRMHKDGRTWVHTGDLGKMDEEGYVIFLQRLKRIIKVSGVPVFPSQIEKLVETHKNVKDVAAVSMPHAYKMEVVALFVVKEGDKDEEELKREIEQLIVDHLLVYAKPKVICFVDKLPQTLVGKVDILALERRLKESQIEEDA